MLNKEVHTIQIPPYSQNYAESWLFPKLKPSSQVYVIHYGVTKTISPEIHIINKIKNYTLAWPLILTVNYEDEMIFVENELLNMWGEGTTIKEAIESFENFFLYDYESYKNTPVEKMDLYARQESKLYKALLNIS